MFNISCFTYNYILCASDFVIWVESKLNTPEFLECAHHHKFVCIRTINWKIPQIKMPQIFYSDVL